MYRASRMGDLPAYYKLSIAAKRANVLLTVDSRFV